MHNEPEAPNIHHFLGEEPIQIASTQELTRVLELSPDALLMSDQTGTILMANAQAEALFGYAQEELQGQPLELLLPQRFRQDHVVHRGHYFAHPHTRPMGAGLQLLGKRKDGSEFPVDISLRPFSLDGALHALASIRDVTMQRLAEQQRLQQVQRLRLQAELINQAHDAIFVRDSIDRIISWNQGAARLYGWSEQEVLGRISHTLLKTRFPPSLAELSAQLERFGQWQGELIHTCRDGRIVTVESRQVLMRDQQGELQAILEVNRDITERSRLEQAERAIHLETSEQLASFRQMLDALPNSVYLVHGVDACLLFANQAARRIWGVQWPEGQPMGEFLASHQVEILDVQGRPLALEQLATLRALTHREIVAGQQETICHPDGSRLPVLVHAVPFASEQFGRSFLNKSGPLLSADEPLALVVHQDVTVLKEAEELKDEFVGIAAHELRTPLAVLTGYADMLLTQTMRGHGPALSGWQQEALESIKEATARLNTLTEDLLDVTRLQAGRLVLHRAPIDIISLIRQVVEQMRRTTTRHQMEISTTHGSLLVDLDRRRAEQVLVNLISNAIKYSPQGGQIQINMQEEKDRQAVCISIQDHGIGIPAHQQAQIFGRFIRADNAVAWGISGTGLGLYLCRALVEQQGGRLWFESQEGSGSTFFLSFPLLSYDQQEESAAAHEEK